MSIWDTGKLIQTLHETAEELRDAEVCASAGNGAVKVVLSGDRRLKSIKIAPKSVRPENVLLLQEQVITAYRECIEATKELSEEKGLNIKNLFG